MVVYLLRVEAPKHRDKYKVGISSNLKKRVQQLRKNPYPQNKISVYLCCEVWGFAKPIERLILNHYKRKGKKYEGFSGNGYSEWIAVFYPFMAVFTILACKLLMFCARALILCTLLFIIYSILF